MRPAPSIWSEKSRGATGSSAAAKRVSVSGNRAIGAAWKDAEVQRLNKVFFLLAILFLACLAASPIGAFETEFRGGPVAIEADSIAYDGDEDAYHAKGKVRITFSGGDLKADAVTLYRDTSQALAVRHVVLRSDQDLLEG